MARRKNLNIHNSDRSFNLKLTTKEEEADFKKVTRLNEKEIEKDMDKLHKESHRYNKRDSSTYMLYKERYGNDTVQDKVFDHGGFIYYYTTDRVPVPVINKLAGVPQSEVIYYCQREYSSEDVKNIHLASMATQLSIDVPIVLPDINPYDYLFALYPLRYHVDKVKLSFPALREDEIQERHKGYYGFYNGAYHLKSKYKYDCFRYLQEPLSTWKMNIWLISDSERDKKMIRDMVVRDNKRFQTDTYTEDSSEKGGNDNVSES